MWQKLLLVLFLLVAERTSDDWFQLVIELQQYESRLDRNDRRFLRQMVNQLTVDETQQPTPAQQKWLLDIARRMKQ